MKKRIFSLCVVFILLFTMLPLEALAVKDVDEAKIYTDYLLDGGYEEIFDYEISKEYMEISTCLIDLNKDGVSELLIALTDTEWGGPRGYACDSALLTIEGKTVKNLHSAYYGGGTMGGDNLVLKYDKEQQEYVAALDGYLSDGVYALFDYIYVYSAEDFSEEYVLCDTRYSKYEGLYDKEIKKLRSETSLYSEDETDVYSYTVNGGYVSKERFETLSARFTDVVDPAYQMYSGTYYAPIKGYSAKKEDDSTPETDDLTDNGYAAAVRKAIEDMQAYEWGRGYGALYDVDGNGVDELLLIHTADISDDSGSYGAATVFSVYTMFAGEVVPLLEKEKLYYEAGDPWGQIGVVKKDGKQYFAAYDSNGGVDDVYWGGGGWRLYTVDKASILCTATADFTLVEDFNNEIVSAESYAMIDGKRYDYSHYEKWVDSIDEMFTIYPAEVSWAPQHEDTMTLEDLLEYLKENPVEVSSDKVELKVYAAFPEATIGTDQSVKLQFSLYINEKLSPIESYVTGISNPSVLEKIDIKDSDGSKIMTVKGLKAGVAYLTFTEYSTQTTVTVPITVEDKCNYFRCFVFPIPDESIGSIYVADFACTIDENGNHDISFNAYNTSYAYGVIEVYAENGSLIRLVPVNPRADGSGMEKVVNGFKWTWEDIKSLFDSDEPFYLKEGNAKHTPVKLDNIPENAEIIISSDGDVSDFVALYTGVDVFVRTVFAASSIDLKISGQAKTVDELMSALADSMTKSISHEEMDKVINQGLIKEAAESISTTIAFSSTIDSISGIYETMYNLFQNLNIDAEAIIRNVLQGMGYSIADALFTTAVPPYKIVNFVDLILESAWPLVDYQFNLDRGKLEIHVANHVLQNYVENGAVVVSRKSNFGSNTVLDAYVVSDNSEQDTLSHSIPKHIENFLIYNITLREDGKETQSNEEIEVRLPIPEGVNPRKCVVYRFEDNSGTTLLESNVEGEFVTFTTTHLSYYLVGQNNGTVSLSIIVFLAMSIVCAALAIVLVKKGRSKTFIGWILVFALCFGTITVYLLMDNHSPNADVDHEYQEEETMIQIEAEDATAEDTPQTESPTEAPTQAEAELTPLEYWIEYCDTRNLTQEDLETFDAATCRLARNAIFAKSGRQFADASLQAFYEQFDWYDPTVSPDDFTDDMLNQYQVHNKDLIVKYEESCGYR